MNQIQETKKKRFLLLEKLFDVSGGSSQSMHNIVSLGEQLGMDRNESRSIAQYLVGEGLIKIMTMDLHVMITHHGIKEVEKVYDKPDEPTTYFPPFNIIHIHSMNNSQIQQGTVNSTQTVSLTIESKNILNEFIDQIRQGKDDLNLSTDDTYELEAQISTLESQLKSANPKKGILSITLESIGDILKNAAGSALASELLRQIPTLLASL